jgi:Holliday junction resolvase
MTGKTKITPESGGSHPDCTAYTTPSHGNPLDPLPPPRRTRGREVEFMARDLLRSRGYHVVQSAGSGSLPDLVAWQPQEHLLLVQAKRPRTPLLTAAVAKRYEQDLAALRRIPLPFRASVQLWTWTERDGWRFFDVLRGGICEVKEG